MNDTCGQRADTMKLKSLCLQATENNTGSHRYRKKCHVYPQSQRGAWTLDGAVQRSKYGINNCKGNS